MDALDLPPLGARDSAAAAVPAPAAAVPDGILLPVGARLLHIGPPKTGTTSLQASFDAARSSLLDQGVRYAGGTRHARREVYAGINRPEYGFLEAPPPRRLWSELAREVREAREPRVVLSSEIFTDASDVAMRRVVDDLGADRVHVVVTLRPLPRILTSQWQQGLKGGLRADLDPWLEAVFDGSTPPAKRFWRRHRHDELIERWSAVVGRDRVTVVIVDDRDHGVVLRGFEALLGLRPGTLPLVRDVTNRSMTAAEAAAVLGFNVAFAEAGLGSVAAHQLRQLAVRLYLRVHRAGRGDPRLAAPAWAMERAAAIEREMTAALALSGVRIVGDLGVLASAPSYAQVPADVRPGRATRAAIAMAIPAIRLGAAAAGLVRRVRRTR